MQRFIYDLRVVWACTKKDIKSALTERTFTIISTILPLNFLILLSLFVLSGGLAPTAVVMHDNGPYAQQFYDAMSHAHSFVLRKTTAVQAHELITSGQVVAVVTIPQEFDARIQQNQSVKIGVQINNLDTDFTNDIRRAVPLSITSFYAKAFPELVTVTSNEQDAYQQDTDYIPYLTVSILVIGLMVGGLLQSGTSAANEWEKATMKELLLSPASRWAVVLGKMLAAFLLNLLSIAVVLAVLIFVIGVRPLHWNEVIGFSLLILSIFIALGTLLGTLIKQRQVLTSLAFGSAIPLFFLSGPFGPISFQAVPVQIIAKIFPVYYAITLQQHAFHGFILNTYSITTNVLILCGYALVFIILAAVVLRRSTVAS